MIISTINNFLIKKGYIIKRYENKKFDVIITSFPKSGRTWLRVLIGKYLSDYVGISKKMNYDQLINLPLFADLFPEIPRIGYGHGNNSAYKKANKLKPVRSLHKNLKIILLVRDPRDVLVSHYFSRTKREQNLFGKKTYKKSISKFIFEKKGSFETILQFYNIWEQNKTVPKDFLMVKYENLHNNPQRELKKIIQFTGLKVNEELIANAVEFASFSNMRKIETENPTKSVALKPTDINDINSYKTRKGKIGDYKNNFSAQEIEYLNKKMKENLSPFFGYNTNL